VPFFPGTWHTDKALGSPREPGPFFLLGANSIRIITKKQKHVPPKHRPTPPIHNALEFLTHPWWMPFVLFWVVVFGLFYVATLFT
jgi:hypothetical protein